MLQVVWFKRDLRLEDHAALCAAAIRDRILPLVIVEPDYWRQPDVSARQWSFWRGCIADLGEAITAKGGQLCIRVGDAVETLAAIKAAHGPFVLRAHEETGNAWTFERDKAVRR